MLSYVYMVKGDEILHNETHKKKVKETHVYS